MAKPPTTRSPENFPPGVEDNEPPDVPGQRRPQPDDFAPIFEMIELRGYSLRKACRKRGLHASETRRAIDEDEGLRAQYARAIHGRGDFYQEEGLSVMRAGALGVKFEGKDVDVQGARGYLDAIKWAVGRMQPKAGPIQRIALTHENMSDEELEAAIAAKMAQQGNDDADADSADDPAESQPL